MMKKIITTFAFCLGVACMAQAQQPVAADTLSVPTDTINTPVDTVHTAADLLQTSVTELPPAPQFGYISYSQVMAEMVEYKDAMLKLKNLRKKYEDEATYNETTFKRQFAEYLQGQKDFPQNIMLKRQRDLQEELEKSLAFRQDAEEQLKKAEAELLAPVKARLNEAIILVGGKLELDYVFNIDNHALPYINPKKVVDVTSFVKQHLMPGSAAQ